MVAFRRFVQKGTFTALYPVLLLANDQDATHGRNFGFPQLLPDHPLTLRWATALSRACFSGSTSRGQQSSSKLARPKDVR
jgi:hypothetical protein